MQRGLGSKYIGKINYGSHCTVKKSLLIDASCSPVNVQTKLIGEGYGQGKHWEEGMEDGKKKMDLFTQWKFVINYNYAPFPLLHPPKPPQGICCAISDVTDAYSNQLSLETSHCINWQTSAW